MCERCGEGFRFALFVVEKFIGFFIFPTAEPVRLG